MILEDGKSKIRVPAWLGLVRASSELQTINLSLNFHMVAETNKLLLVLSYQDINPICEGSALITKSPPKGRVFPLILSHWELGLKMNFGR
jgi:hypothetical protein